MKALITFTLLVCSFNVWSQSVADAFLFAKEDLSGTARYLGMAGAFGALGGDLAAITDNPAAAGVFNYSEIGFSVLQNNQAVTSSYFSSATPQESNQFRFDHFGLVYTLKNSQADSDWTKIAFAFNTRKVADFASKSNAIGTNSSQNLGDYFRGFADGLAIDNIEVFEDETIPGIYEYLGNNFGYAAQQAFLGYQGYAIDPFDDSPTNASYISNILGPVDHDWIRQNSGRHRKNNFALSAVYKNKLYIGAGLNSHRIRLEQQNTLHERSSNSQSPVEYATFENTLDTYGSGLSAQVGLIYQLPNSVRFGLSYQSPQWWLFEEEGTQSLTTESFFGNEFITTVVDPKVINYYPSYKLVLPSKTTFSFAYVINQQGLLSIDYSRRNLGSMKFETDSQADFLGGLNTAIENDLSLEESIRIGGEYRMGRLQLQGGFFTTSNSQVQLNKSNTGITAGLSYDLGGDLIGLSWVNQTRNSQRPLYDSGITAPIVTEEIRTQILFSYLLKL